MSLVAIALAGVLRAFIPALATYGVLIVVGCGLLYYRRREAIGSTRKAGGNHSVLLDSWDRWSLGALIAGCLASGIVIALEIAAWDWGEVFGRGAGS
jgi:hypothetical protein